MKVVDHFPYTGREQRWTVPAGVTAALVECWGAAGGMASEAPWAGKEREVVGGSPAPNNRYTNLPEWASELGRTYSNNGGYVAGVRACQPGETYFVYVGGNGGQGFSTIMLNSGGKTYTVKSRGGAGGWNGGGTGGAGASIYQKLFNGVTLKTNYKSSGLPSSARSGQVWYDTTHHLIKKCNHTYTKGHASNGYWDTLTVAHAHAMGGAGGGGGGGTDIRLGDNGLDKRIMVAGGSGGAGGPYCPGGKGAWPLYLTPTTPLPLGVDAVAATVTTGPDKTYASPVNYFGGGIGLGGAGGQSPTQGALPTPSGGQGVQGMDGGQPRSAAPSGSDVVYTTGQGRAATPSVGGAAGGGTATDGQGFLGGNGSTAPGGYDDFGSGGAGGGGGLFGGGGGSYGWHGGHDTSWGGGGGGGSSYVGPEFSSPKFIGAIRPPHGFGNAGTGANGLGGFARISYSAPPSATWGKGLPTTALTNATFVLPFTYAPALAGGSGIGHYQVGTSLDADASDPTAVQTFVAAHPTDTALSASFVAPSSGSSVVCFVRVIDVDGDVSPWITWTVTALSAVDAQTVSITSPASGTQFIDSATLTWDPASQHPLVAYRLGVSGTDLDSGAARAVETPWRRGGSRVNLALDPGFRTNAIWASTANVAPVSETAHPGVSGYDLKVAWLDSASGAAEVHTAPIDNLRVGRAYRFHVDLASAVAADPLPCVVEVHDADSVVASYRISLAGATAGGYVPVDFTFTPRAQGVYFVVRPSATVVDPVADPVLALDFEDTTLGGFSTGASSATYANSGDLSLKTTATSTRTLVLPAPGAYVLLASVYAPNSASTSNAQATVLGSGITGTLPDRADAAYAASWQDLSVPFTWDGTGTVQISLTGDANGFWWDDVEVHVAGPTAVFGNARLGQVNYLANMVVEVAYEEDETLGYGAYFDGASSGGSWLGTANASPSLLTGTDVTTGTVTLPDTVLTSGSLTVRSLTPTGAVNGYEGSVAAIAVAVNPSLPATPTVSLLANSDIGLMRLTVDAADSGANFPTTYYDVFRNGVRIATGLKPNATTRLATFWDDPGHGALATYTVRAFDAGGGYVDVSTGTVTLLVNGYLIPVTGPNGLFSEAGTDNEQTGYVDGAAVTLAPSGYSLPRTGLSPERGSDDEQEFPG